MTTVFYGCAIQKFGGHYIACNAIGLGGKCFRSKSDALKYISSMSAAKRAAKRATDKPASNVSRSGISTKKATVSKPSFFGWLKSIIDFITNFFSKKNR